ncbi:hypothetical protein [Anaerotignum sp.]|nr:hypothetical protein [Anaerotignum sp.]
MIGCQAAEKLTDSELTDLISDLNLLINVLAAVLERRTPGSESIEIDV